MLILGIETSCDECSASVVEDGRTIRSNVIRSQIPLHAPFMGVVPEIASRAHVEWIKLTVRQALDDSGLAPSRLDGIAATARPGLLGSLLVGLSFAKGMAWSLGKPFIGVDHMLAHLYAPFLSETIDYPFLGLLVSGGHSIICRALSFDEIEILGTTMDDAAGEAFDKVAKHFGWGYPGGAVIDRMAQRGDARAFRFSKPDYKDASHRYDVSYSGLKTAVVHQLDKFLNPGYEKTDDNIAASFNKAAVEILYGGLRNAIEDTGLTTVVAGGGVAANSHLRARLASLPGLRAIFPPLELCGDNGAMVAGLAFKYFERGDSSPLSLNASARVPDFRRAKFRS